MSPAARVASPALDRFTQPQVQSLGFTSDREPIGWDTKPTSTSIFGKHSGNHSASRTQALVEATRLNAAYDEPSETTGTELGWGDQPVDETLADDSSAAPNAPTPDSNSMQRRPLVQDIERNIIEYYQLRSNSRRVRHFSADNPVLPRGLPRAGALTNLEKRLMHLIEYHLLYQMLIHEPWLSDCEGALEDAMEYAEKLIGLSRAQIVETEGFEALAMSKLPKLRSGCLLQVKTSVERTFGIVSGSPKAKLLLADDKFLYPNEQVDTRLAFRSPVITEALIDLFFRSSKKVGLPFIRFMIKPDDRATCASWHAQLSDRTATRGLSVSAIAFAATTVFYTLDKLARNAKTLRFDDQGYKMLHYDRFFRQLLKLKDLGKLRNDLLDRIKQEHLSYWPAGEVDEDTPELDFAW
ncbi:hypothetical protein FRC07_012123 [Ceratobasidium sp. 392]|nr:hypothetical protein FRC07_012123 [Ceratobasidium sp. 392]